MEQLDHKHAGKAPGDGEAQADVAVEVKGLVGVVPPPLMEQLLQGEAGEPLQGGGEDHRAQKQQGQAARQGGEAGEDDHHAKAVDGADGPVEKAPVDKGSSDQGGVAHLGAPAQEGVDEENPEKTVQHNRLLISYFLGYYSRSRLNCPAPGGKWGAAAFGTCTCFAVRRVL